MKQIFIGACIILFSCAPPKFIPLKGHYPASPVVLNSENSFDTTWDNVVNFFAQKGLAIKGMDKNNGLIISDKSLLPATAEDKNGKYDPTAYIAVPSYISNRNRYPASSPNPHSYATHKKAPAANPVYGDWNVKIKPNSTGGSTITINLTHIIYEYHDWKTNEDMAGSITDYQSTGVFENMLAKQVTP